jgi:hypothetical protein
MRFLLLVGTVSVVGCVEPAAYGPCRDGADIGGPTLDPREQVLPAPSFALEAGDEGNDLVVTFDGDGIERTARFPLLGDRVPSLLTGDVAVTWEAGDYARAIRVEDVEGRLLMYGTALLGPTIVSSQAGKSLATAKDNVEAQETCREASDVGFFIPVVIHADGSDITLEAGNTVDFELDGHPMHAELPWATQSVRGVRSGTMLIWDRSFEP